MTTADLLGQHFGRYTVTAYAPNRGHHKYYTCVCACGNTNEVRGLSAVTISLNIVVKNPRTK